MTNHNQQTDNPDDMTLLPFAFGDMLRYCRLTLWRPIRAALRWMLFPKEMRARTQDVLNRAEFSFTTLPPEECINADGTPDFIRQVRACAPQLAAMNEEIAIFFERFAQKNYVGFQVQDIASDQLFAVTICRVHGLTPADVAGRMRVALEALAVAHPASLFEADIDSEVIPQMALAMCGYNDPPENGRIITGERISAACRGLHGHDYVKVFRFLVTYNAWLKAREDFYDAQRTTN